ncbi:hypothetical protein [Parapedobacter soli]|uniref:hypothetical protein n=1 Tax=Parapedobacter soli TaxID=416955 RepID=UPI0021C6B199|nr:hypothetical protein [Parapedobacter soli]
MTDDDRILKEFLEEHFDFYTLKKAGFFPKEIKKRDIHAQAERICKFFGYKTVFEYGAKATYAHISYAPGHRPLHVNEKGELKEAPFMEKFGGIYDD